MWLGSGTYAMAQPLPGAIREALSRAGLPPEALYLSIVPAKPKEGSAPGISHQGAEPVNPASVIKLITTAAGLDRLGTGFQWNTRFYADAAPVQGHIKTLYIQGEGDPAFHIEELWLAMRAIRQAGVVAVDSALVLDRSAWSAIEVTTSFDQAPYRAYHAKGDPLLLNHGATTLWFEPNHGKVNLRLEDAPATWEVRSALKAVGGPCRPWKDSLSVRWQWSEPVTVFVGGEFPAACGVQRMPLRVPDYDVQWRDWVREIATQLGIQMPLNSQGVVNVQAGRVPATASLLTTWPSKPLPELVREINKFSNNVMAHNLANTVFRQSSPMGFADNIMPWLKQQGINTQGWVIESGSGLSRVNRITTDGLAQFLQQQVRTLYFPDLLSSLPVAGVDGTLSNRLNHTSGAAYLKTGRLNDVASLAGYVRDVNGQTWVMVAVLSHPQAPSSVRVLDKITEFVMSGAQ